MTEIWRHYEELMSDPAHMMVELTFILLVDVIFLGVLWPLVKKAVNRRVMDEHRTLDEEHGVEHE